MRVERKIVSQRCYKIPKNKLDLFLVRLNIGASILGYYEAEYIFESGEDYDVVVNGYGHHSPFMNNEIQKFVEAMNKPSEAKG